MPLQTDSTCDTAQKPQRIRCSSNCGGCGGWLEKHSEFPFSYRSVFQEVINYSYASPCIVMWCEFISFHKILGQQRWVFRANRKRQCSFWFQESSISVGNSSDHDGERGSSYHFAMSGKSYQVIFQHFNSLLPKVSTRKMKGFCLALQSSEADWGIIQSQSGLCIRKQYILCCANQVRFWNCYCNKPHLP